MYKVGIGYDVHSLEIGKPFILGGIKLNHSKGSVGYSDADVLIHAICDALLGALNLRDIGFHFPDNEKKYEWQKKHLPNLTGTKYAYSPKNVSENFGRNKENDEYKPWTPT